jgi:hypothetical protein
MYAPGVVTRRRRPIRSSLAGVNLVLAAFLCSLLLSTLHPFAVDSHPGHSCEHGGHVSPAGDTHDHFECGLCDLQQDVLPVTAEAPLLAAHLSNEVAVSCFVVSPRFAAPAAYSSRAPPPLG